MFARFEGFLVGFWFKFDGILYVSSVLYDTLRKRMKKIYFL